MSQSKSKITLPVALAMTSLGLFGLLHTAPATAFSSSVDELGAKDGGKTEMMAEQLGHKDGGKAPSVVELGAKDGGKTEMMAEELQNADAGSKTKPKG